MKNENSDDVEQREQNNRWLESLKKVRHSEIATERASQERTQTHDKVRATESEREQQSDRATTQATTKEQKQNTNDNKRQSPLHHQSSPLLSTSIEERREG